MEPGAGALRVGRFTLEVSPFARLWSASAASNLGDGVGLAAAPLLAASLTRDPALVAGLTLAQRLPWFLFTLVSGALVDRLDRKSVLGWGNAARALALAALGAAVLSGQASLPALYLAFFVLGAAETLVDNAALAILPAIVPRRGLERANGRLFATQTLTNEMAGPALGGALFGAAAAAPFLLHGALYALAAALIGRLRGRFHPGGEAAGAPSSLAAGIRAGLGWFWRHRLLRTLGMMAGVSNLCSAAALSVFVLHAQDRLGLSAGGYGLLLAVGALGGAAAGLAAETIQRRLGGGATIFLSNLLPALAYLAISRAQDPLVVGIAFILLSFAPMVGNVVLISLRQAIIPDALLGRVTSAYRLFALGALPLGALIGGALGRASGLTAVFALSAAVMALTAFAVLPVVNNRALADAREGAR